MAAETPTLPLGSNPTNTYDSAQFWSHYEIHTAFPIHTKLTTWLAFGIFFF